MPDPIDNVAANSDATSAWANSVADAVNELIGDLYSGIALAIPWASLTGVPASFAPSVHAHLDAATGGLVAYSSLSGIPAAFAPAAHALAGAAHTSATPAALGAWAKGSAGGGAAGVTIWVGTTAPASPAEGDVWIKG